MDHPDLGTTLCERCQSLLAFDDLAAGCRAGKDAKGVARLLFDGAKLEWRYGVPREKYYFKMIQLRWHLEDSLPHLPQLSDSGQSGCDFCNSLLVYLKVYQSTGELSEDYSLHDGPISLVAYVSLREEGIEGLVVELVQENAESEWKRARLFFPIEASPSCHKWLGAELARRQSYLAPESISEIRRVLAECTTDCHPWRAAFLPTRLIDVGTSSSDIPRLVLSSDIPMTAETKYAALSYCWADLIEGFEPQIKTETATLESRCEGIPCEIMTPTIKDAVELTKAIDLRYIWIDALCIVQDDTDDWSYESGQMNRVYQHAFVTLCNLGSDTCHLPFLQRARRVTVPFQSTIRPEITGYLSVGLRPVISERVDRRGTALDLSLSMWPKRAWTYQEERLSTRLLLFGATRMHFRCGIHKWSQGDEKLSRLDASEMSLYDRIIGIKQGEFPATSLYEDWRWVVLRYCSRAMTYETDRLPAIAGLARLVGDALGDRYLAGLWKGDILNGLAWSGVSKSYGLQNHLQSIQEREYIAPSWSWASYDGGGLYNREPGWQNVSECTILDFDVWPDKQNPFGRVWGGFLQVRGKVAPVPSSLRQGSARWWLASGDRHGNTQVEAYLDWLQQGEEEECLDNLVMLLLDYQQQTERPTSSHPSHTSPSDSVDGIQKRVLRALMLYPTEEMPDGYYRVGLIHSRGQAGYNLMRSWFESERNEKLCNII